jgi:hypothetical protein
MSAAGVVCLLALMSGLAFAAPQARAATKPIVTIQPTGQSVSVNKLATFISTATGDPKPTIKWEQSDDGKSWKAIPGATANMLKVKAAEYKDGWRYRAVFRNSAGQTFSKSAKLDITQSGNKPKVTLQPLSQSVIVDSLAVFKATAGGTPKPTVQWQQSRNGSVWTYLAGENKTVMSFKAKKSQSGYLYRAVFTNANGSATTRTAVLTVIDASRKPVVTLQPLSQSVRAGFNATFKTAAVGDPTPTVKWETRNEGGSWRQIAGATRTTYRCEATRARDGDQFRAVFKNSAGQTYTKAATLDVIAAKQKPKVTLQPVDEVVDIGDRFSFTAKATGVPTPKVQWQQSRNGRNWDDIPGARKTTYSFKATKSRNGLRYRALFTNSAGTTKSKVARLTVTSTRKPVVITQPMAQTVVNGNQATFTSQAEGTPTPKVQWQRSTNGSSWKNIAGATGKTLKFAATKAMNGYRYRAVFSNSVGITRSNAAKLTVIDGNTKPIVTRQPSDDYAVSGGLGTFSATATGVPTPTVQWQISTNGTTWADIVGATNPTYQFVASSAMNGWRYRAVFRNSAGSTVTSAATLRVMTAPTVLTQPTNQAGTIGATAVFLSTATGVPQPTVQWQYSPNGGSTWIVIPGATQNALSVGITGDEDGYLFRAVFTNTAGSATSTAASLTVLAGL